MSNQKNIRAALGYDQLAAFCRDTAMLLEANIPLHLGYADIYGFAAENAPLRRAAFPKQCGNPRFFPIICATWPPSANGPADWMK